MQHLSIMDGLHLQKILRPLGLWSIKQFYHLCLGSTPPQPRMPLTTGIRTFLGDRESQATTPCRRGILGRGGRSNLYPFSDLVTKKKKNLTRKKTNPPQKRDPNQKHVVWIYNLSRPHLWIRKRTQHHSRPIWWQQGPNDWVPGS